jgi:hypothetical protein
MLPPLMLLLSHSLSSCTLLPLLLLHTALLHTAAALLFLPLSFKDLGVDCSEWTALI